eukprot:scaffold22577_cov122-Cylindrotheca_fusiformis.AAC.45
MSGCFTSTTAPEKTFSSRSELADHYRSDWHKYNLKRREAGLPLLKEVDFQARWEAALSLKKEKNSKARSGTDHLKNLKKNQKKAKEDSPVSNGGDMAAAQANPEIDPKQSLFDSHRSETLQENVLVCPSCFVDSFIYQPLLSFAHFDFHLLALSAECLVDLEGLLGYCHEKIKLGHYCLYCEKMFPTWQGCQKHMVSKQHTKIRYEQGFWQELDPFYSFEKDDKDFLGDVNRTKAKLPDSDSARNEMNVDSSNDDGWEDMSDGEEDVEVDDPYDIGGYEKEIAKFGLDVTPLGELVFPDGRVVGHRGLRRYYDQRFRQSASNDAVVAAKHAAGERMYDGRVVNIGRPLQVDKSKGSGKGILVSLKDGAEGFSTLSLYRYRAAIRKQHRDDDKGRRLTYRTTQNINRMDKKANRLMNGVSVAHAAR